MAVLACLTWAQHGPQARPLASTASPVAAPAAEFLSPALRLPEPDQRLRVVAMVTVDIDFDGDVDAAARTSTGRILVWLNDGTNRLLRKRKHRAPAPRTGVVAMSAVGQSVFVPVSLDIRTVLVHLPPGRTTIVNQTESRTWQGGLDARALDPVRSGASPRAPPVAVPSYS